ncbi:V-set and transmembrane domain-containing protein 2-like protein isoform X2 [Candoia aspera]|uniref:V-set and transmembrane domain-containing protein 2-like protein isoform X2 n=1 Tax=Candoia aspera TaxID=51853 RepID=UPI002FD7A6A6
MGGAFGLTLALCHSLGLYLQLGASSRPPQWENQISGNAFFTETPHDMTARAGEDVEMACSFRGSSSPSYSLEIQWWYMRARKDWAEKENWDANQVVKVAGSNISHKLRLSRVRPADEGTYECRVIDFSDRQARHHKAQAYLRVQAEDSAAPAGGRPLQDAPLLLLAGQLPERGRPGAARAPHQPHPPRLAKELKKRSLDEAACAR